MQQNTKNRESFTFYERNGNKSVKHAHASFSVHKVSSQAHCTQCSLTLSLWDIWAYFTINTDSPSQSERSLTVLFADYLSLTSLIPALPSDSSDFRSSFSCCAYCSASLLSFCAHHLHCNHSPFKSNSFWVCSCEVHPFSFLKGLSFRVSVHSLGFSCFHPPSWTADDERGFFLTFRCKDFKGFPQKRLLCLGFKWWQVCSVFKASYRF